MRAICRYVEKKRNPRTTAPYATTSGLESTPVTIAVASAIPPRSAAMLNTLATTSSAQAPQRIDRGYRRRTTPASPRPVTIPSRAHMSCTPAISGNEKSAVHSGAYPNDAPVTEYVEMPDGSSSAAPVTKPGPSPAKNTRHSGAKTPRFRCPPAVVIDSASSARPRRGRGAATPFDSTRPAQPPSSTRRRQGAENSPSPRPA